MAALGWIDFSSKDRNRVGSALELLSAEGTIDELGLGTIRDALANAIFPGISTIQTRAKYFFIVPYLLYDYQTAKPARLKGKTPSQYLDDQEHEVMWNLAERYHYQEGHGVIGISKKRGDRIIRRPSTIYWSGLATYQFIETHGLGLESFLLQSKKANLESLLASVQDSDDAPRDDQDAEYENLFQLKVSPRLNWREGLDLNLSSEEAEFFRDRIIDLAKHKLIAELLQDEALWELTSHKRNFMDFAQGAAELPLADTLRPTLTLAHDFSELMYGAHLAYNCQLQRTMFGSDHFDAEFETWWQGIPQQMLDYEHFDPTDLFHYARTTRPATIRFIQDWWRETQLGFPDFKRRDYLILHQEALVKGNKARLYTGKVDDVRENTWLGLRHFEYRYIQARKILNDIRTALNP